jgi:PAS domain S-box-containing protein
MEETLRKERNFANSVVGMAQAIVLILDMEGHIVYFNPYFEAISGYILEEVKGKDWFETFLPPRVQESTRSLFRKAIGNTQTRGNVDVIITKDGHERLVEWYDTTLKGADGNIEGLLAIGQDVTDRKKAEETLRETEERYKSLFDRSLDCVYLNDFMGNFIDANQSALTLMGYTKDEITSLNFTSMLTPDQISTALKVNQEILATGTQQKPTEYRVRRKDGRYVDIITTAALVYQKGKPYAVQGIAHDITERKRAEVALWKSEEQYHSLLENVPELILVHRNGIILYTNPAAVKSLGYQPYEALNRQVSDFIAPEFHERVAAAVRRRMNGELVEPYEIDVMSRDGSRRRMIINGSTIEFDGAPASLIILVDITERKKAEDALRESKRELADIISFLPDATLVIDKNGTVLAWNRAMEKMTGVPAEQMIGKANYEYALPFYHERRPITADLVLHDDPKVVAKYTIMNKEGSTLFSEIFIPHFNKGKGAYLWFIASPLYDEDGNVSGAIESIRDITDQKQAEEALHKANKQLNLLSSITRHDILNQLLVLRGYLELSHDVIGKPEELKEFIKKEQQAANTIDEQITFTRDYQELGAAAPEWQNVNEGIRNAMVALPMRAVHVEVDPADPKVYSDPLFEKVFYNLIDNALRYGGDQMKIIRVSSHESDTSLVIVCEDDGVGITDEDKKKLFRKGFGKHTGLGLFLSREILSITGITITENGTPGKGARFEITVPKGAYRFNGTVEK